MNSTPDAKKISTEPKEPKNLALRWGGLSGPQPVPWPAFYAGPQRPTRASAADQGVRPTRPKRPRTAPFVASSSTAHNRSLAGSLDGDRVVRVEDEFFGSALVKVLRNLWGLPQEE